MIKDEEQTIYFYTKTTTPLVSTKRGKWCDENFVKTLLHRLSTFERGPSGARLSEILSLSVHVHNYQPMRIGSFLPISKRMRDKKTILNICNKDDLCFLHCLNASVNPARQNENHVSSYPPLVNLQINLQKLTFPMPLSQLKTFEKNNPRYSVNVFGLDDKTGEVVTYYQSQNLSKHHHVNLLLLEHSDKIHYCLVRCLSRLCASQLEWMNYSKIHCDRCFAFFKNPATHERHLELCLQQNNCAVRFPRDKTHIKFTNYQRTLPVPFVIYADTEYLLQKTKQPTPKGAFQKHTAFNIGSYLHSNHEDLVKSWYEFFRGKQCTTWFAYKLHPIAKITHHILKKTNRKIRMSRNEIQRHRDAKNCFLCGGEFTKTNYKVAHHQHLDGTFISYVHNLCNFLARKRYIAPVLFHSLQSYDSLVIIKEIAQMIPGDFHMIARNSEEP